MVLYKAVDGVTQGGWWCCSLPGSKTPTSLPQPHSVWEGLLVQASHWRWGNVGHQGLDSAHQVCSAEVFYLTENRGLCWAVWWAPACHWAKPSRKSKIDTPANANPKISWIMRDSTSIKTCRESHKNLYHQLQETKNGSRSIKSPAHTHWTSRWLSMKLLFWAVINYAFQAIWHLHSRRKAFCLEICKLENLLHPDKNATLPVTDRSRTIQKKKTKTG